MSRREFHTRRQWHNVSVWAISSLVLVLFTLVIAARSGEWWLMMPVGLVALGGFVVTFLHDRSVDAVYTFESGRLRIWNKRDSRSLRREDIRDASLVDRTAARTYILQKLDQLAEAGMEGSEQQARKEEFIRFCTVDIGLRSFTFGLGRKLVDTMPNAKHDLVLLRLTDGHDLLLSPLYNQDLMDNISRMLRP